MNKKFIITILLVFVTFGVQAEVISVDVSSGKTFPRSVVGMNRTFTGATELLNLGGAMRGPAGGGRCDAYDWQKNTGIIPYNDPITLDLLIESRDSGCELLFSANMVGTGPTVRRHSDFVWTNTDINMLTELAADWVTYTNFIVPNYHQGDTLPASYQDIVDEITWSPALLASGAAATSPIEYWEIGNEVEIYDDPTFVSRYKSVSQAMLAVDSTIKVGPAIIPAAPWQDKPIRALLQDPAAVVDFVAIHSYQYPNFGMLWDDIAQLEQGLRGTSGFHRDEFQDIYDIVLADRGIAAADNMEYLVSEWNSAGYNNFGEQRSMANALSAAETIFTHADLGIRFSNYWVFTRDEDHGLYAVGKVFMTLAKYMGDTLVEVYPDPSQHSTSNHRLYVTKDSLSGMVSVWGLNFSNDQDWNVSVDLNNAPAGKSATIMTLKGLQQKAGLKTLDNPGVTEINWQVRNASGMDYTDFDITVPAAGMVAVVIDDVSADYEVPAFYADRDPNLADQPASYADIYENTWTAYEVSSNDAGDKDSYVPMVYSFEFDKWLGNYTEYNGALNNAVVDNSDTITSYVDGSSVCSMGVLGYKPRVEAKIKIAGTIGFNDMDGSTGGTIAIRKFEQDGSSTILENIAVSDGGVIDLASYSSLAEIDLAYGDEVVFEVCGSTANHTYLADFSNLKIIDLTCDVIVGDINGDCYVNLKDFSFIAEKWLEI